MTLSPSGSGIAVHADPDADRDDVAVQPDAADVRDRRRASATRSTASRRSVRGHRRRTPPTISTLPAAPTISIPTKNSGNPTTPASIRKRSASRTTARASSSPTNTAPTSTSSTAPPASASGPSSCPANLDVSNLSPQGATEISGNTIGPRRQQGHGRAGHHARRQDPGRHHAGAAAPGRRLIRRPSKLLRIVTIDIATGTTHEYGYMLTTAPGSARSSRSTTMSSWSTSATARAWATASAPWSRQLYKIDLSRRDRHHRSQRRRRRPARLSARRSSSTS